MDSAVTELMSAEFNANGVLTWFFEILRQPLSQRSKQQERYSKYLPRIPTTVLFNYSRAQAWYGCHLVPLEHGAGVAQNAVPSPHSDVAPDDMAKRPSVADLEGRASIAEEASMIHNGAGSPVPAATPHTSRSHTNEGPSSPAHTNRSRQPQPSTSVAALTAPQVHPQMVVEYQKRKASDLTTHHIVSALCSSYKDIAHQLKNKEKERRKDTTISSQRGNKGPLQRNADTLPNMSLAAVAKQLPRGRLCAQTIRKSNVVSSSTPDYDDGRKSNGRANSPTATKNAFRFIGKSVEAPTDAEAAVQYFDEHEVGQLLFHGTLDYALLQRFDHPAQSHAHDPTYNSSLIADWQPNYCFVSRSECLLPLTSIQQSSQLRGDTTDPRVSEYKGSPGWNVQQALCNACNALAERVYFATNGIRIRKMSVVFKIDSHNNVILQWCQSAAVAKGPSTLTARDELVAKMPFAVPHTFISDEREKRRATQSQLNGTVEAQAGEAPPPPRLLPIPKHYTYGTGDLNAGQEDNTTTSLQRPYASYYKQFAVASLETSMTVEGTKRVSPQDAYQPQPEGKRTTVRTAAVIKSDRRPATSMGTTGPANRSREASPSAARPSSSLAGRTSPSQSKRDRAIYGGSGVRITVNRRAAEVRQLMEETFGPTKNRGLLTRTKLDYMQYQLHQNTAKGGAVAEGPDQSNGNGSPKRGGRSVIGGGGGRAKSTTAAASLQDILRLGLEELEKDKRFEELAPRGWTRRRQGRRQPSVHNLLAMKAQHEQQEAERALVRSRMAAAAASSHSTTSPYRRDVDLEPPTLLDMLSGEAKSRPRGESQRPAFVPFSDEVGAMNSRSPSPSPSAQHHPKTSSFSLADTSRLRPWHDLGNDELATSQTIGSRHLTLHTLTLSHSQSHLLLSAAAGEAERPRHGRSARPSTSMEGATIRRRTSRGQIAMRTPNEESANAHADSEVKTMPEVIVTATAFPSEDTIEVDSADGSQRRRFVVKYTHHRHGGARRGSGTPEGLRHSQAVEANTNRSTSFIAKGTYFIKDRSKASVSGVHYPIRRIEDNEDAEIIDNRTWGKPSRVSNALLLPLDRDEPFSINRIAADAGRLGHRELYLNTMNKGRPMM